MEGSENVDNYLDDEGEELNEPIELNEPKVGMVFDGINELFEFYKDYAKRMGFPMKKRSSKKNVVGDIRSVTFSCARGGKHDKTSQNPLKSKVSYRIGCTARLTARLIMYGRWEISVVALEHNHELSPSKARFFRCNRRISAHMRHQINPKDQARIKMNKNFGSHVQEAGGRENLECNEKDCRNLVEESRRLRLGEGDASAIMRYFSRMVAKNSDLFFDIELDEEDHLENIFWADGRSREAYKEFGDVVTFDTTYLTKKYDMPFVSFVGVNHHGQSILLGCALVSKEDTNTFVWVFNKWLECMDGCAPQGIITDQDRAIKNAIEIAFPNTRHRWCLWHIMKKMPEKFGKYNEYEAIISTMKSVVYDTQSPTEFDKYWYEMINKYALDDCEWLIELYKERNRWAPCFVKNNFWAGMSTTQRSESMNAFFDGYVHSKTSLKQFVEQYEIVLRNKVEKEIQADADSFSKQIPTATNYMMEKQIQGVYTLSKYKEFQTELTGKIYCEIDNHQDGQGVIKYIIQESFWLEDGRMIPKLFTIFFHAEDCDVQCSCQLFVFKGILCRHALSVLIHRGLNLIPDKYIIRRWRKDVRRAHSKMKVKFNSWEITPSLLRYRELTLAFSEVADLVAPIVNDYDEVKKWIDNKLKELQISQSSKNPKEIPQAHECVEDVEDETEWEKIKDPLSQTRKGRPRKNIIKTAHRRSKKNAGNVPVNIEVKSQAINLLQSQVGVGISSQESVVSNMVQPREVYQLAQQQPLTSPFQMLGHLYAIGTPPIYVLPTYGLHQSDGDQRNRPTQ